MTALNKIYLCVIILSPFVITWLHHWLSQGHSPPIVLEEIYYLPLFLGILRFGLKGAIWTYGIVSVAYLPFLFGMWATTPLALLDRFLHLLFSGIFAFLAGFLIDRERRHQKQLEKDRYLAGLGQVAATIVHDLKNPLIAILAFSKRIREGKGDIDKAAHVIWDSAQNMQKIVEGTLDIARPIQLDMKRADLTGLVGRVFQSCRIKAEQSGVTLHMKPAAGPIELALDSPNMERALTNLVNNSIEASSKGQDVILSAEGREESAVVRVTDRGMGMDREVLENLFVPFYTKKSKGTGLGMAIAKKIVEGHSGKITVESRIGHGTQFMVELVRRPLES